MFKILILIALLAAVALAEPQFGSGFGRSRGRFGGGRNGFGRGRGFGGSRGFGGRSRGFGGRFGKREAEAEPEAEAKAEAKPEAEADPAYLLTPRVIAPTPYLALNAHAYNRNLYSHAPHAYLGKRSAEPQFGGFGGRRRSFGGRGRSFGGRNSFSGRGRGFGGRRTFG